MVGTPPADGDLLALDQLARRGSASHLRISTSLRAGDQRSGSASAKQPVAWKNGTDSSEAPLRPVRVRRRRRLAAAQERPRAGRMPPAMMLDIMLRWVASAPFGFPVVPEV